MSLKSRKRTERNREKQAPADPLLSQKQAIRTATLQYLAGTAVFLALATVTMLMVLFNEGQLAASGIIFAGVIIWSVCIFYICSLIRRFAILQKISKIHFSTEQSLSVNCRKVSFLLQPEFRFSSTVLCVMIVDENENKFCYIYPKENAPSEFSVKYIKAQLLGRSLELRCYQNSNIVKTPVVPIKEK